MIRLNVPYLDDVEIDAITNVMRSGDVSQGKQVEEFEERIKKYTGAKYAIATSGCTSGLFLVLKYWRDKAKVPYFNSHTPAFTFPAADAALREIGHTAIHLDVRKDTYNLDPEKYEKTEYKYSFPIVVVDEFGLPADRIEIERIAKERNCDEILYDSACALGSEYKGERIGRWGTAVFSFHGRKIITTGEGGMVVTDDEELYEKVLEGRQFGRNKDGKFVSSGLNFKMADINAAIGLAQMEKIDDIIENRWITAERYNSKLRQLELDGMLRLPPTGTIMNASVTNWQSYVVRLTGRVDRDAVMKKMRAAGIEVQVGSYDNSNGRCQTSFCLGKTTLALPIWSAPMPGETIEKVVEELGRCIKSE
jgi:perosamine synthetase